MKRTLLACGEAYGEAGKTATHVQAVRGFLDIAAIEASGNAKLTDRIAPVIFAVKLAIEHAERAERLAKAAYIAAAEEFIETGVDMVKAELEVPQ